MLAACQSAGSVCSLTSAVARPAGSAATSTAVALADAHAFGGDRGCGAGHAHGEAGGDLAFGAGAVAQGGDGGAQALEPGGDVRHVAEDLDPGRIQAELGGRVGAGDAHLRVRQVAPDQGPGLVEEPTDRIGIGGVGEVADEADAGALAEPGAGRGDRAGERQDGDAALGKLGGEERRLRLGDDDGGVAGADDVLLAGAQHVAHGGELGIAGGLGPAHLAQPAQVDGVEHQPRLGADALCLFEERAAAERAAEDAQIDGVPPLVEPGFH